MELRKGSRVLCPSGRGTVTDRCDGESLVQLDKGSILSTSHGQWWPDYRLSVVGFDPDAMVWIGARVVPAGDLPSREV
jgi:hypothetical protein